MTESPVPYSRTVKGWGVRVRRREGFGWGKPSLAGMGLFAFDQESARAYPSPVAVFQTEKEARQFAKGVRSVKRAAQAVRVRAEFEATL